ncbi:hypothetical protein [Streptomyces pratensis]|uniref:hypothetical protein n=1 Tax=Streptomyces pratensis TaxID=1169025 RepID=UPI00362D8572
MLHRRGGEPSFRTIAQRTAKAISHTTAGNVLRCDSAPGWGPLELVVEALGGDTDTFRTLWVAVRDETSPLVLPAPAAWVDDEPDNTQSVGELGMQDLEAAEDDLHESATERERREGEARLELLTAIETRADLTDRLGGLREKLGRERGLNEGLRARIAALEAERDAQSRRVDRLQDELRSVSEERVVLLEKLNALNVRRTELNFDWAREEEKLRRGAEKARKDMRAEARDLRERLEAAEALLESVLAEQAARGTGPGEVGTADRVAGRGRPWYRSFRKPG